MHDDVKMEDLFLRGLEAYHNGEYFDAHEYWEDLWSDFHFKDRRFIQGLIQMSVSFVHLKNDNLNGAKGLMRKCLEKFDEFSGVQRNIDVTKLKTHLLKIQIEYGKLENTTEFNWDLIPELV